ncbi:MAG: type II toxin-antitoxin system VapC family toxin [Aggregatilineales bacterium]
MTVVIDANILIAFGLADEPLHTQARQILSAWQTAHEPLVAPRLFRSEITAVVRKAVYQQRLSPEQGRAMLSELLAYPVDLHEDVDLLKAAYDLAVRFNRPRAYDTQYMALAERLQCDFWTADERLVNSTQGQFNHIRWLGNWNKPE